MMTSTVGSTGSQNVSIREMYRYVYQVGTGVMLNHRWGRILVLGMLYLVQGLPFGFQVHALPVYLREQGVGLEAIGYSTALALPWALKFLWAPFVERFGGGRGSRYRWIAPVQLLMVLGFLWASQISPDEQLQTLMVLLLMLNGLAATQDIAVDGLAVDLLGPNELGLGNSAQVVGYKVGMLCSGGLLVWATAWVGWQGAFLFMAALVGAVALVVWFIPEPQASPAEGTEPIVSVYNIVQALMASLRTPGMGWFLLVIATYKMGESFIDVMYKPFLIDQGITASQIGLWIGTWGMAASLFGSVLGGLVAMRFSLLPLLWVAGAIRLIPELGQFGLAMEWVAVEPLSVIVISLGEHFAGGVLTTVMFATMMGWVDRRIGASHFTLLACVEVWGKSVSAMGSGWLAVRFGYAGTFGLGIAMGVGFLLLLVPLVRKRELQ
jgi:PAT family beta-lactamase induction signal transducer AmpG